MGTVLELRPKVDSDWTLFERTQLESLIQQAPGCEGRDLVFGVTDAGDPWCAALDDGGEVTLHVARINGRVVVHAMAENVIAEGHSLSAAISRFINEDLAFRRTSNVAQLFPAAQPLPAHMFGALGESSALPVGDFHEAAEPLPAQAPAPAAAIAAISAVPAFETAEARFAWDFVPLALDNDQAPGLSTADQTPASTAPPQLITAGDQITIDVQTAPGAPEQIIQVTAQVQTFNTVAQPAASAEHSGLDAPRDADIRSGGDQFTLTGPAGPGGGSVIIDFTTPRPPLDGLTAANDSSFVPAVSGDRAAAQDETPPPVMIFFDSTDAAAGVVWPSGPPFTVEVF